MCIRDRIILFGWTQRGVLLGIGGISFVRICRTVLLIFGLRVLLSVRGTIPFRGQKRKILGLHFGGIAGVAAVILPLARSQSALYIDLIALAQVFLTDLGRLVANNYLVPFCSCSAFACFLIGIGLTGRYGKPPDTIAVLEIVHFHLIAQITDQHHLVQCTAHCFFL